MFSLDFNHGAQLPATDFRATDISDRINAHVDAAFFAKRAAEPVREYIGASAIGNDCLRAVQLQRLKVKPDKEPEGKMLRIWETGHIFEAAIAAWLKMAGFELDVVDPTNGKQFTWRVLDEEAGGSVDGILRGGPLPIAVPCLWECKALKASSWQETKKKGLYVSKPYYAKQFAINQAYLELHQNPGIFTALNKDTSELYHELVPFDQSLAQRSSDDMVTVVDAIEQQVLLPRAFSGPDNFKCRMCDFSTSCWNKMK
jgi:hypothetical protein